MTKLLARLFQLDITITTYNVQSQIVSLLNFGFYEHYNVKKFVSRLLLRFNLNMQLCQSELSVLWCS